MPNDDQTSDATTRQAPGAPHSPTAEQFHDAVASPEFQRLRSTFRRFSFPMSVAFLVWYFFYVLASSFAPGLMATVVVGHLNLGILLGLAQFVTTFGITWAYIRRAGRVLDPMAASIRTELEGGAR